MEYAEFIEQKQFEDIASGHHVELHDVNSGCFEWQKYIVRWAIARGRAAVFADTGLGKTRMQVSWADLVPGRVLIFAPLAVAAQTVREARKIGIDIVYSRHDTGERIVITNYEMMDHFDLTKFTGVVLDESSILKSHTSSTRGKLIEACQRVPYRLSCTATPSPNDFMELGNQADFLGIMTRTEMLAMFFIHDGGDTAKWRLKGHGKYKFWEWMSTWSVVVRKPSDLGFSDDGYILPELRINKHIIEVDDIAIEGEMFARPAQSLMERRQAKRKSIEHRVNAVAELVNADNDQWLVWCHLNDESDALSKAINGADEVKGSDKPEDKEKNLLGFSDGKLRALVTKPSIAGFGMNWQQCNKMAFVGLDDSFEQFYQAIRRCWRFGQTKPVDVHVFVASTEGAVLENIERKEQQHIEMSASMAEHMRELMKEKVTQSAVRETAEYVRDVYHGEGYALHLSDCVDLAREIDTGSIDYTVFSPPFASLYTYSNSPRDMGNAKSHGEFYDHFRYLIGELFRITSPGRLLSFHCMNLPTSKQNDGYIGIRDFRGELIRMFVDAGWIYHSEVCIWKDPVTAMQRTKALGLLHKQIKKDSAMSRQGIADYLVTMRKPGDNPKPITHTDQSFPVDLWQKYASPVWMDINPSRTLQFRDAREDDDERHICPLQLDVIERAIELWSNPGDLIYSPFTGIGSEGYVALKMGRKFIGSELKRSYWELAKRNLAEAIAHDDLFASAQ